MTVADEGSAVRTVRIDGRFVREQARSAARLFFMPITAPIKEIMHPRHALDIRIQEVEERLREVEALAKHKTVVVRRHARVAAAPRYKKAS